MQRVTVGRLQKMKREGEPIAMVTAYDFPTAQLAEKSGVDVVLVGDSLGMVVLGYESTVPVTIADMVHHTRAVRRGLVRPLLVADLPFLTYHQGEQAALTAAGRLMQEGGATAVKMEGGRELAPTVAACVAAGIPVMGHIGLLPQAVHQTGYRIRGKSVHEVEQLQQDAEALAAAGAFALVLECVTEEVARAVSEAVAIPTIGIGSGRYCDGQVLVFHDLVRFSAGDFLPSFAKTYADVGTAVREGLTQYVKDVKSKRFPDSEHTFRASDELVQQLYGGERV